MKKNQETINLETGEKIELFNRRFSSVPMKYEFSAKPLGSQPLAGLLEIHSKKIVFPNAIKTIDLKSANTVSASLWDTFVTIYVIAGCDMEVSVPKPQVNSMKRIFLWAGVLVLVAALMLLVQ